MHFGLWVLEQEADPSKAGAMKRLERATGVGYMTIQRARHGTPIGYTPAKKLADEIGGAVTVDEFCSPPELTAEEQERLKGKLSTHKPSSSDRAA